jgi:hypothetical protein
MRFAGCLDASLCHDLAAFAHTHGLERLAVVPQPWTGATSWVFPWGDVVIKVPHDRPEAIHALRVDAAMNTVFRDLGVAIPLLRTLDESDLFGGRPVGIYDQVLGALPLSTVSKDTPSTNAAWFAVGQHLARIHQVPEDSPLPIPLRTFRQTPEVDPRPWVGALRTRGLLTRTDADWLARLLDHLAPAALEGETLTLCHGDVNAANVLVDGETGAFRALIDLAGAGWLDPAWDGAAVPLAIVPHLLAGHRSVAGFPGDASAEHRILWCQLQTRLHAANATSDDAAARRVLVHDMAQIRAFVATTDLGPDISA